jgi:hypothetical protein
MFLLNEESIRNQAGNPGCLKTWLLLVFIPIVNGTLLNFTIICDESEESKALEVCSDWLNNGL